MNIQTAKKPHTSASVHLDALRGLAALLVFWSHLRALFFVDYRHVIHKNILIKSLYFLDGFGHASVMIFFVLSGFLISSSVLRSLETNRWSWEWYAQNRLTRLYVVLLPALLLGAFWDFCGIHLFGLHSVYGASVNYYNIISEAITHTETLKVWLGNLFYLQVIFVPPFGSNNPLWSLSFEFWYYVLFPLCLFAFSRRLSFLMRLVYAVFALDVALLIGKGILLSFPIWLMGTALCFLPPITRTAHRWLFLVAAAFLGTALVIARFQMLHSARGMDYLLAAAVTVFLYFVLNSISRLPALYEGIARFLSSVSYTLYLVHMPFLFFVTAFIFGQKALWQPDNRHIALSLIVIAVTFAYTYLVWRLAEANTDKVRRFLVNRLSCQRTAEMSTKEAAYQPGINKV